MVDTSQYYYSDKSYILSQLIIYPAAGGSYSVDVTGQLMELTIFEDMFSPTLTGSLMLSDAVDLPQMLQLTGFDYLQLIYAKPGDPKSITKTFRIFSIDDRDVNEVNQTLQVYKLRFCSEELLLSETMAIYKSYQGKSSTDIIKDALTQMNVPASKISANFETPQGTFNYIIPGLTPLATISFAANRSVPPHFFFENRDGFNFRALNTMVSQKPVANYWYGPQNVDLNTNTVNDMTKVIRYKFLNSFDVMDAQLNGMYGSQLSTIDPIKWKQHNVTFSYADYFNTVKHLDAGNFENGLQNRNGKTASQNSTAYRRTYPTNRTSSKDAYVTKNQPNIKPSMVEQWMLQRQSTLEQLHFFKLKMVVPGSTGVTVGDVVTFAFPSYTSKDATGSNLNPLYTGNYLITAIRHKINYMHYEMIIEATKDSLGKSLMSAANGDASLKQLVNS